MTHSHYTWDLEASDMAPDIRSLVYTAVSLRMQAAVEDREEERVPILDEAQDLLDEAFIECVKVHGVDRYDLVDIIDSVDRSTRVRRR